MKPGVLEIIESSEAVTRDLPIDQWCEGRSADALLEAC